MYFKSSDGALYELDEEVALAAAPNSPVFRYVIEDNAAGRLQVLDFDSEVLDNVLEFLHARPQFSTGPDPYPEEVKVWDAKFVNVGQQAMLCDLIMAARYLDIPGLLLVTCKAVADMIYGKTPDEIRKMLNIENDFSPEEEEQIRKEMEMAGYYLPCTS